MLNLRCGYFWPLLVLMLLQCNLRKCNEIEYFSSTSGLEDLLQTETILLAELTNYVTKVTEHLESLKGEIETIQREHIDASKDLEGYLNNPINAYRLIKRLHSDWTSYEESIRGEFSDKHFLDEMARHRATISFPRDSDVEGSAVALVRLQETYKLDVSQVASGILNGVKYGSAMSWQDCFILGHQLFVMRDFNHTIPWLQESMNILRSSLYYDDPMSLDFMEAVVSYHQEMGDFDTALKLINQVLALDPTRTARNSDIKLYLEQMITDGVKQGLMHETATIPGDYYQSNEYKLYEQVCREELTPTPAQLLPLSCKYHTNNLAYRLLQPFHMEVHNLDPYIVQFHDVIGDKEIEVVKRLAKPRMERSQVHTGDSADTTTAKYRTSKSAWFEYSKHHAMERMLLHLQHFSGLNTTYAERLQVANYGIGGHYDPHWDFFLEDHSYNEVEGNRISTAIYYLSDVEEGGGTAFPFLNLLIKPKRGSVLFWYNLHSSEEPDYRTKHAACPVLKGTKWIANIWVRVRNQERERPCGLQRKGDISIFYKDHD